MMGDTIGTKVKRFFGEAFGIRGSKNLTSWVVAGGIAYYFIYLPEQQRQKDIQAARLAAKQHAIEKGIHDIDRARPIPDPQDTGLIQGIKAVKEQQQQAASQQQQ